MNTSIRVEEQLIIAKVAERLGIEQYKKSLPFTDRDEWRNTGKVHGFRSIVGFFPFLH